MPDSFDRIEFQGFWDNWGYKYNKRAAMRAFQTLKTDERRKATERAEEWCAEWRRKNPTKAHIHASVYLKKRLFLDQDEKATASQQNMEEAIRMQAQWIRDGKHYLAKTISAALVREMLQTGLVTPDECRKAGV